MRKRIEWEWERLDETTWRAKVIGGWLVKNEFAFGKAPATSMQLVPDRDHEWNILQPVKDIKYEAVNLAKDFESK